MDGRLAIRELRPADAAEVQAIVRRLSPESRRKHVFASINEATPKARGSRTSFGVLGYGAALQPMVDGPGPTRPGRSKPFTASPWNPLCV